jgi:putative flippase GtrA
MINKDGAVSGPAHFVRRLRELAIQKQQVLKYFLIGGSASAIDVILFLALYNLAGTSELVPHSLSVPTSVVFSFVINARHNFRTNDYMFLRLLSFCAVCTIGFVLGYGVITASETAGLGANLGKILSLPLVFITQYLLNSRITFRKRKG